MATDTEPTVWIKALRWHTYQGRPINEGEFYLAHEDMVETIEILKFGKRDDAPPRAVRRPEAAIPPPAPVSPEPEPMAVSPEPEADREPLEAVPSDPTKDEEP